MTFQQFLEAYNGKYIDFDGYYGAQCMDLMHQYIVEVLGINSASVLAAPCAKDVYNNFDNITGHDRFERIPNTPTGMPNEGDIMFWGNGTWGHVAIYINGDVNGFNSFDQNYPTGTPCHVQGHNYDNVLGWLRMKPTVDLQAELDKCRERRDELYNICVKHCETLNVNPDEQMTALTAEIEKLVGLEDQIADRDKKILDANKQIENLQTELTQLSKDNEKLDNDNQALTGQVNEQKINIAEQDVKIKTLTDSVDDLKTTLQAKELTGFKKWLAKILFGI